MKTILNMKNKEVQARDHISDGMEQSGASSNPDAEKRLVRKIDKNLIPLVMVLYLLSYLDRSNIGNARIAGLQVDLDLSSSMYQWLLTIFYISYVVFEWFAFMWKLVPPHIWASICVTGWGTIASLQAVTSSFSGMMAARFFLGMFEAGYGPGIPYFLSFFYLRHEIGLRIGIFLSAAPLATCFAGALAYSITSDNGLRMDSWRLLFLVEGLPVVVMGVVTWLFLPDSPEKARFLSADEKTVANARGVRQVGDQQTLRLGHISLPDLAAAFADPKNYCSAIMYFSCNVSFSSLPVFLPTILNEMGFTAIHSQGLSAPPYFVAFLLTILSTYIADRSRQRGLVIVALSLIGATGYILLATTTHPGPRYVGVYFAAAGIFPTISNILPWVLNNQGSDTKRGAGIAILNLVGQCGPLLGTRLYPEHEGPLYRKGMWICAGFMLFNSILALTLRSFLSWENKRLDRHWGPSEQDQAVRAGDENDGPRFRYVL